MPNEIEIEAFRADTLASQGITEADIAAAASGYDPEANPAPLVFGHPRNDSPSLGLISGARAEGKKLFLKLSNIAEDVIKGVKEKRILNRSIAFWHPDHPSNPVPGQYSIRHLGLLGGMTPAIPGMSPLKFSADEDSLESDDAPEAAVVFEAATKDDGTPVVRIQESEEEEPAMPKDNNQEAEFAARQTELEEREAAIKAREEEAERRETEFAAAEAQRRTDAASAIVDGAVEAGKLLPAEADDMKLIFGALSTDELEFSSGKADAAARLGAFIEGLDKRAPGDDGKKRVTPDDKTEFNAEDSDAAQAEKDALAAANAGFSNAWKGEGKA